MIPQRVLDLIPPRAFGYEGGTAELFPKYTAPAFDPLAAAATSADITVSAIAEPHRAARLIAFHAENAANPSLDEVLDRLIAVVARNERAYAGAITRTTRALVVQRLEDLAANGDADPQVRAEAEGALRRLAKRMGDVSGEPGELASRQATRDEIARFLARPAPPRTQPTIPDVPPGPPIGD
jgi:hypothetical protein